jgi:putative transposase
MPAIPPAAERSSNRSAALKNEMYHRQAFPNRLRARFAVADYIEVSCNRQRLHSTLGYRTPAEVLTEFQNAANAA